ncbi:MAG: TspO/MBR family protein [Candidatus Paceibacterota bacterium]
MNILKLIIAIAVPLAVGFFGSLVTAPAIDGWYAELAKPALNPPGWVFGPVWTLLYVLMGAAAFLVWQKGLESKAVRVALGLFVIQLVLNGVWSLIFFGLQNPLGALVDIIVLWILIVCTMIAFYRVSPVAMYLLVPYLLWVSFAVYLNAAFVILN